MIGLRNVAKKIVLKFQSLSIMVKELCLKQTNLKKTIVKHDVIHQAEYTKQIISK